MTTKYYTRPTRMALKKGDSGFWVLTLLSFLWLPCKLYLIRMTQWVGEFESLVFIYLSSREAADPTEKSLMTSRAEAFALSIMTTANNANVPLLHLPVELIALIPSDQNDCGVLDRMFLRRTCALRAAVPTLTLAELEELEQHWDVAAESDLYATCRCRFLGQRER